MYVLSIVLLVGAELNDVLARRAGVVQQTESITSRARGWRDDWRDGWRDRRSRPAPDAD